MSSKIIPSCFPPKKTVIGSYGVISAGISSKKTIARTCAVIQSGRNTKKTVLISLRCRFSGSLTYKSVTRACRKTVAHIEADQRVVSGLITIGGALAIDWKYLCQYECDDQEELKFSHDDIVLRKDMDFRLGTLTDGSDRNRKENVEWVEPTIVLDKLMEVPVATWNYIGDDASHMGPMAQDFYAAFGLGESDTGIGNIDMHGALLAAVQALKLQNEELRSRLQQLEKRLDRVTDKR